MKKKKILKIKLKIFNDFNIMSMLFQFKKIHFKKYIKNKKIDLFIYKCIQYILIL